MTRNKFSYKSKVHFFFGGGLLLAFSISVAINFFSGQHFSSAIVSPFREIRPVEYIMFFLFWYWFAHGRQTESRPTLTTLNLGDTKT